MGLVLSRREGDVVLIGNAKVTVGQVKNGIVRLHVEAPKDVKILRGELKPHPMNTIEIVDDLPSKVRLQIGGEK